MSDDASLIIALISEVFHNEDGPLRLRDRLIEARGRGAELAILPEIPLNSWCPATKAVCDEDAEQLGGPRCQAQAEAAEAARIGLIGGAIIRNESGERRNTALIYAGDGRLVCTYEKLHVPEEPGFWETSHYSAGHRPPEPIRDFAVRLGVQICSDINRPQVCHFLAAQGAEAIIVPRCTEHATFERWRHVFVATALTTGVYIVSVNRPAPEQAVMIGGPSIVVDPRGQIAAESAEPMTLVTLRRSVIEQARQGYPGYLPVRSDLYLEGWQRAQDAAATE